jgi:hypothetical protein
MWDALWTILVVVVLAGVVLLFIVDAIQERTTWARAAAFVTLAAGVTAGMELSTPWLPLALIVVAVGLGVAGRVGDRARQRNFGQHG